MKNVLVTAALLLTGLIGTAQLTVNQQAPEIALPGIKGNEVSLSSLKGKVVLVDFWASWCGPCRAGNPAVVKLYNTYKEKGFEVFGVSIDAKKADWLKAIANDKIKFTQVNDAAGWNSAIAEKYGVNAIPNSFLLDKEGKLIAINLEGEALENKVKELLGAAKP